jgi:predicted transcriptional regulator
MEEEFPILAPDADLEHLKYLISSGYPAVIIREKGSIKGLISKIDLISYSKDHSD